MAGALAGVRVLDFSEGIAGPMAAMHLADQEADVVKVERLEGDRMRSAPGYLCWNRNKQRITLDLGAAEGLRTARALISAADVALFDGVPGSLDRLGLDAGRLRAANPGLVHAWLPPYGTEGRWSLLPPDEGLLQALTGSALLQHSDAGVPVYLVAPLLSYGQALLSATAVTAALLQRQRNGWGAAVEVSGLHAFAAVHPGSAIRTPALPRSRAPAATGPTPGFRLYRCADGEWIFFGGLTPAVFLRALDPLDLIDVMAWEGVEGEYGNILVPPMRDKVMAAMEARFAERPSAHWLRVLREADVPSGAVGRRDDWFHGATVAANGMRIELEDPVLGAVELPGLPLRFSRTPGRVRHLPAVSSAADVLARWAGPSAMAERSPAAAAPAGRPLPLDGIRVLDLGAFIATPLAGTLLATFGADVVKVEPPSGDPFRRSPGPVAVNTDKRGLALDLAKPEARAAFRELARGADAVLDNFRPGVRERLEIDAERLCAGNPRLVDCSLTAFGEDAAIAGEAGLDPIVQARSGMMTAQGGDHGPVLHLIAANDVASGMTIAFGVLAALFARESSGQGQQVRTALVNQSVMLQSADLTGYAGRPPRMAGGRDYPGPSAAMRYYACRDGWLLISCASAAQLGGLAEALGHPEWLDAGGADLLRDAPNDGAFATQIASILAPLSRAEVLDRLLAAGVPAAPAIGADEIFDDPWLAANGVFQDWEDAAFGRVRSAATFATWEGRSLHSRRRTPTIGEHNRDVLADYGFSEERIAELEASGALVS